MSAALEKMSSRQGREELIKKGLLEMMEQGKEGELGMMEQGMEVPLGMMGQGKVGLMEMIGQSKNGLGCLNPGHGGTWISGLGLCLWPMGGTHGTQGPEFCAGTMRDMGLGVLFSL